MTFWQHSGLHPIDIPVDFFPVYATATLITANQGTFPNHCLIPITDLIRFLPCPILRVRYQTSSAPTAASSPIVQEHKETKAKAALNHPLRISIMNCQSLKNKKAELHTIIDSAKPDIILGNESWLTPDIKNSEITPDSFDAVRKYRASNANGGVFIAFKRDLLCTETLELDTN